MVLFTDWNATWHSACTDLLSNSSDKTTVVTIKLNNEYIKNISTQHIQRTLYDIH